MENEKSGVREEMKSLARKAKVVLAVVVIWIALVWSWDYLSIVFFWGLDQISENREICKTPFASLTISDLMHLAISLWIGFILAVTGWAILKGVWEWAEENWENKPPKEWDDYSGDYDY